MSPEDMELKKAGLKVTLPRIKILQILENTAERHMTAEDIYQSLRDSDQDVGIATVYRVLTSLNLPDWLRGIILILGLRFMSWIEVNITIIWYALKLVR